MPQSTYDVLIAGGGNAGLSAALMAAERGARVIIVDSAPKEIRGGNSRHTRNLRVMSENYSEKSFLTDLDRVTGGGMNAQLAELAVRSSPDARAWMMQQGVRFQPALEGTLHLGETNAFFLGGGKAVLNAYYFAAQRRGIEVLYDAEVIALNVRNGAFESAEILHNGEFKEIRAKTFVAASGGFESNLDWLEEAWGPAARNFLIRGTSFNRGRVLKFLLENGAQAVGDPTQCHAIAIDARSPKYDGGIVTRLDSLPLGIVVNRHAERFYDEGEDLWPKRYAIWGRLIAQQPDQIAYSIFDSKLAGKFMPSVFPVVSATTIAEIAKSLGLAPGALTATVEAYNRAVIPGSFDLTHLDDCRTRGLTIDKTHWAQKIDTPPYLAYPLRPGITFTYLGVKVDEKAQVQGVKNVYAAGEIMAGNILSKGYLGGLGMTIGSVFGRIAGVEAARAAL